MHRVFITGAAGFIGSNLVDRLLAEGVTVTGWDNLGTGQLRFLEGAGKNPRFKLVRGDNLDLPALTAAMQGSDFVFHLAANADIKDGWSHPRKDLEQNTIATFNVLEAMLHVIRRSTAKDAKHRTQIYNLGTPEYVEVNQSIGYICTALGLQPEIELTGGNRGWIGDNPFIFLDTKKIQATGWKPKLTIAQGIMRTLGWLEQNRWVYDARPAPRP